MLNNPKTPNTAHDIFVFGSNLAGRHGKGAALHARQNFGAVYGVGSGPTGNAYAIPTKDQTLKTLPLSIIQQHVEAFLTYAKAHRLLKFQVTPIGTGLAGYKHSDIAPMFANAPANCGLPDEWKTFNNHGPSLTTLQNSRVRNGTHPTHQPSSLQMHSTPWLFIQTEPRTSNSPGLWTVGILSAKGRFQPESDHASVEAAATRITFLNQADRDTQLQLLQPVRERLAILREHLPPLPRILNKHRDKDIPATAKYIGRPGPLGNPWVIGKDGTRDEVIARHKAHLINNPSMMLAVLDLRGSDLVCFCAPAPCHGEIYLALANGQALKDQLALIQNLPRNPPPPQKDDEITR